MPTRHRGTRAIVSFCRCMDAGAACDQLRAAPSRTSYFLTDQRRVRGFLPVRRRKWMRTGCSRPLRSISISLSCENWRPSMRRRRHAADTCGSSWRQSSRSAKRVDDMPYKLPSSGIRSLTVNTMQTHAVHEWAELNALRHSHQSVNQWLFAD